MYSEWLVLSAPSSFASSVKSKKGKRINKLNALCFCVLPVFVLCIMCPLLPLAQDCPFLITPSLSLTFISHTATESGSASTIGQRQKAEVRAPSANDRNLKCEHHRPATESGSASSIGQRQKAEVRAPSASDRERKCEHHRLHPT